MEYISFPQLILKINYNDNEKLKQFKSIREIQEGMRITQFWKLGKVERKEVPHGLAQKLFLYT